MKLKSKQLVEIIIALIAVFGSIITAIIINNKNHDGKDKIEAENSITADNDNKQLSEEAINSNNEITNYNILDMISILEKLRKEGNDILNNYNEQKQDFKAWKSKCKGILKETDPEIERKLLDIEKEYATFDYHSQIIKIIELLDSEITNQKTKAK